MNRWILVLGGTGILGEAVVRALADRGHTVRVMTRSVRKARERFGTLAELVEGDPANKDQLQRAMEGMDAVHISLPTGSELPAVRNVVDMVKVSGLARASYISGTSVRPENRWFPIVDEKVRAEELLAESGIPHTVFCPTWVMEVLHRFVQGGRAAVIEGRNPPGIHFFAAKDFGRMVAASYDDGRTIGKRLFIHGPEAFTLTDALMKFLRACCPDARIMGLKLWQARLIARLTGKMDSVSRLIGYFDEVGEPGDPAEANGLLGAPSITLDQWIEMRRGRP